MSKFADQEYLKTDQYKDASNLNARVALHQRFSTNPYGWMRWVFDHFLNLPEDAQILELGCGPAHLWKENINRLPTGWRVTLSDLSPGMLDAAWRNLVVTGRAFQFREIDAQSIPFESETFDAVIANHMLYHVPERPKAIAEIWRVLKPGGQLFATTVGQNHLKEIANWIQQVNSEANFVSFGSSFTLENGFEQLKQFFPQVTVSSYPDSLHVTEVKPIIDFMMSTSHAAGISKEKLTKLEGELKRELNEKGKIFVQKDSGLFAAIK